MNREGQGRGDQYRKLRTQARAPALHKFFGVHRQECLCHKTIIAIIAGIARDREPKAFHRKGRRGRKGGSENQEADRCSQSVQDLSFEENR